MNDQWYRDLPPFTQGADVATKAAADAVYVRKQSLQYSGGRIYGWFETSFNAACTSLTIRYWEENALEPPQDLGTCSSGDVIYKFKVR